MILLIVLFLISPFLEDQDNQISQLNRLVTLFDGSIDQEAQRELEVNLDSNNPAVRLLSLTILYRADTKKYAELMLDEFAVHDYLERANGKINFVNKDDILNEVALLEKEYSGVKDQRVMTLLGFIQFQDSNIWFKDQG